MPNVNLLDSDQLSNLISQNQQMMQLMIAKEIGKDDPEWLEKAFDLVTKAPANTMTAQKLHGLGGTFSTSGLERDVISTHIEPSGIASVTPLLPSVNEDPRFGALTGFSDDIGDEPSQPCDDAPQGFIKACNLTAQFGRVARDTETIEMDKVMLKVNRGDFTDLVLHGLNLGIGMRDGVMPRNLSPTQILNVVTMSQMTSVGVRLHRLLNRHYWQGSPANNNVGGGYAEGPGLDVQIATGQVDADSNTACPSLDSDVKDFNYNDVCGTTLDIVEYLSMLEWFLFSLAEDTGMSPTKWRIFMRAPLWQELTACWPCKYNTNRCTSSFINDGDVVVNVDGVNMVEERDRMRRSMTIDINGRTYPVTTDTGIFEHNNVNNANLAAGQFASPIYMVPMDTTGNFPVTYREHIDYRRAEPDVRLLRGKEDFWTDAGVFSWAIENNKWCWKLSAKTEQRIVLRTPQLAGRIDNVMYSPLQHLREPDPSSPYWVDGGVSVRATGNKYAAWL
jgi:hypothetical protein